MTDKDMINALDHWEKWLQDNTEKLLRNVSEQEARISVKQHQKLAFEGLKITLLKLNN